MVNAKEARVKTFESAVNKVKAQTYEYRLGKLIDNAVNDGKFDTSTTYDLEDDAIVRRILEFYNYSYRATYFDKLVAVTIEW